MLCLWPLLPLILCVLATAISDCPSVTEIFGFTSDVMARYCCEAPGCPDAYSSFSSQRGLTIHRNSCQAWSQYISSKADDNSSSRSGAGERYVSDSDEEDSVVRRRLRLQKAKRRKIKHDLHTTATPDNFDANSSQIESMHSEPSPLIMVSDARNIADPSHNSDNTSTFPEQPHEPTAAMGRPIRSNRGRLPARYRDVLPQAAAAPQLNTPFNNNEDNVIEPAPISVAQRIRFVFRRGDRLRTFLNPFGLWREYPDRPSCDPDGEVDIDDLSNIGRQPDEAGTTSYHDDHDSPLNTTQTLLTSWQNNGNSSKSNGEMDGLVQIIQRPDFDITELKGYSAKSANEKITKADEDQERNRFKDSFKQTDVEIEVPSGSTAPPRKFQIPGLLYRNLLSVIQAAFSHPLAHQFHFTPFRLFQNLTGDSDGNSHDSHRVYSDLYNSDVYLDEHEKIRTAATDNLDCRHEKVIAALMCWSDATQLANFGTAKLWPVYMLFGNISKYIRSSPNSGAVHHLAYIPSIPDAVKHEISKFNVNWKTQMKNIMAHCNRELYHAVWTFLLNDDFVHAYKYGILIECADGITRRVYPRFFTYSADYPEKVLLATIRDLGSCPCPRCLQPKTVLDQMGMIRDMALRLNEPRVFLLEKVKQARQWIYERAYGIKSAAVERLLHPTSSVPTMNAFVDRLGQNFNVSRMLAPDFLHEFELGVWKALFSHLIRVLYAVDPQLVEELDNRLGISFRQVPTFGVDTIRRFANNASEMKKLAARDFEDLLQCSIPVFENLLPEPYNRRLMTLLYRTAEWHALAKLRIHTDVTLSYMERRTAEFGKLMRQFRDLSNIAFDTYETLREVTARNQRQTASRTPASSRRQKKLNLSTYKFHALGDYTKYIRLFGPTDVYSTQLGELAHRVVKKLYGLGNKKKDPRQIGRRLRRVEWAKRAGDRRGIFTKRRRLQTLLIAINTRDHHYIGQGKDHHSIGNFISEHRGDPAAKSFLPKLQDHILGRLMENRKFDGDMHEDFSHDDRNCIRFAHSRITELKTVRVNYTTYDVRRDQDNININNHADIMVLSADTEYSHPYWYAQVLGIFRATISSTHPMASTAETGPVEMEFLWVRWYGIDSKFSFGPDKARLPKIGFVDDTDDMAFGFLDPVQVIRACHLIPSFSDGRTSASVACDSTNASNWEFFYVNIFADRDMFMRYFPGGGVGHVARFSKTQLGQAGDNFEEKSDGDEDSEQDDSPKSDTGHESGDEDRTSGCSEDTEDSDLQYENDEDGWQWDDGYASM
ncbi:hypothetical protein D9757_000388 [Collybiopsis confluens]|uniref:Uncharacterized protein n=1 Tax=Collybiopsis confluens TaxID=2823264 RepID=A0A8H5MHG4_9AGAR|nr:hypothetical protein D9757_000388 [Collybiopsis confluens]